MAVERKESIDKDKIKELLEIDGITKKELTQEEIKEISKNFSVQDLYPIAVALNNPHQKIDGVKGSREKLGMNILSLLSQCNENEKQALSEENQKKVEEQQREINRLQTEKAEDEKTKNDDITALKALLEYDDKKNEENKDEMDYLIEDIALNNKNRVVLDNIKAIKQQLDADPKPEGKKKEELEKQRKDKKEELRRIIMEKNFAYFKNFSEQYDNQNLKQLETKRVSLTRRSEQKDGERVVSLGPQLRFRQNRLSRQRINRTIQELNAIGNKPKEGVRYVLSRTFGGKGVIRGLKSRLLIKDVRKFDEMYNAQKKHILDDLEAKMDKKSMSARDRDVIAAVRKRLDYYQLAYKKQFITI